MVEGVSSACAALDSNWPVGVGVQTPISFKCQLAFLSSGDAHPPLPPHQENLFFGPVRLLISLHEEVVQGSFRYSKGRFSIRGGLRSSFLQLQGYRVIHSRCVELLSPDIGTATGIAGPAVCGVVYNIRPPGF